jgi:hypothetical protein
VFVRLVWLASSHSSRRPPPMVAGAVDRRILFLPCRNCLVAAVVVGPSRPNLVLPPCPSVVLRLCPCRLGLGGLASDLERLERYKWDLICLQAVAVVDRSRRTCQRYSPVAFVMGADERLVPELVCHFVVLVCPRDVEFLGPGIDPLPPTSKRSQTTRSVRLVLPEESFEASFSSSSSCCEA